MMQGWFSRPVEVAVGVSGSIRHISNAEQAAELLTGQWRDAGTEARLLLIGVPAPDLRKG